MNACSSLIFMCTECGEGMMYGTTFHSKNIRRMSYNANPNLSARTFDKYQQVLSIVRYQYYLSDAECVCPSTYSPMS